MAGSSSHKNVSFSDQAENSDGIKIETVPEHEILPGDADRDSRMKLEAQKVRDDMRKDRNPHNPHVVYDSFLKPGVTQEDNSKKSQSSSKPAPSKEEMEKKVAEMQAAASAARAEEKKSEEEKAIQERQLLQKIIAVFDQDTDEAKFLGCALVLQHGVAFRKHTDYYPLLLKSFPGKFLGRLLRSNHVGLVIALVSFFVQSHKEGGMPLPLFVQELAKDLLAIFQDEVDAYLSSQSDSDRLPAYLRLLAEMESTKSVSSASKMRHNLSLVLRLVEAPNVENDGDDDLDFSFSPPVDLTQSICALTFHWRDAWERDDAIKTQFIAILLNAFIADDESEPTKENEKSDSEQKNEQGKFGSKQEVVAKSTHVEILPFLAEMLDGTDCYICKPTQQDAVIDRCLQRVRTVLRTKGISCALRASCIRLAGCLEDLFGQEIWWRGQNVEAVKVLMQIAAIEVHVNLWSCLHEDEEEDDDVPCDEQALTIALSFCERMCQTLMEQEESLPSNLLPDMFNALHKSLKSCLEFLGSKPDGPRVRVVPAVARLVCFWTMHEPRQFATEFLHVVEYLNSELSRSGDFTFVVPAVFAYEPIEWVPFAPGLVDNILGSCMSDNLEQTRFAASTTITEAFLDYRLDMKEYLTKEPPALLKDYRPPSISAGNTVTPSSNIGIDRPQLAVDADDKVRKLCLWAAGIDADCAALRLALLCTVPNHIAKVFIPQTVIDEIIANALQQWDMLSLDRFTAGSADREGQWFRLARAIAYSLDLYPGLLRGYRKLGNDFCAKRELDLQGELEYTENHENTEEALSFDGEERREAILEYLLTHRQTVDLSESEDDEVVTEVKKDGDVKAETVVGKASMQNRIVEVPDDKVGVTNADICAAESDDGFLPDDGAPLPEGFC